MWRKWLILCSMILGLLSITHLAHANSVYYGPTTNQDHFWQIVDKFRPNDSITREQMAVALLQANPAAFADGNVNALRNGQMLRVPTTEEVQQTNAQAAFKTIQQMNQTWQASHPQASSTNNGIKTIVKVTPLVTTNDNLAPFGNESLPTTSLPAALTDDRSLDTASLQQQLRATKQELQQLEQQVNLQVGKLVQQNLLMQAQLANNNQVLEWVLEQMQKNNISGQRLMPPAVLSGKSLQLIGQPLPTTHHNGGKLALGIVAIIVLVLLGVWLPQVQRNRANLRAEPRINKPKPRRGTTDSRTVEPDMPNTHSQKSILQANEYDFLSGQEGMAAKLNIARVYLDMEDFATAAEYLVEIMAHGNEEQRREAERLYQKLKTATIGTPH